MTQVHFTLKQEDTKNITEESVSDDLSKNLFSAVFNQPMEEQREEYLGLGEYERDHNHISCSNNYCERAY